MMSLFAKDGTPKIVPELKYPVTGLGCVTRIYTDHGVFLLDTAHSGAPQVTIREAHGLSVEEIAERLEVPVLDGTH